MCVLFLLKIHEDSFYNVEMSLQFYLYLTITISITMHEISKFHIGMLFFTFIVCNLKILVTAWATVWFGSGLFCFPSEFVVTFWATEVPWQSEFHVNRHQVVANWRMWNAAAELFQCFDRANSLPFCFYLQIWNIWTRTSILILAFWPRLILLYMQKCLPKMVEHTHTSVLA